MTTYPPNFKHPKTHKVYECQTCGLKLPAAKELPYGFYIICEDCLKKSKEQKA